MINTPVKQLEMRGNKLHPAGQLAAFILLFAGIFLLGNVIAGVAGYFIYGGEVFTAMGQKNYNYPNVVPALWLLQIVGTTFTIFLSAVCFAYFVARDPQDYLKPAFRFPWLLLIIVFGLMFISSPLIEYLSNINQKMVLPQFLSGVQNWMKDSEESIRKASEALLKMNSVGDMLFDLLVIGLLTAIAEEFMFRGIIQTIFTKWTKNYHVAIWITAILFSAFHMEFFGFLPRMFLGVLFGYFVAWSGSIWPAVWAHFLNNGTAVVITYLYQQKQIKINPDDQHLFPSSLYVLSLVIVLFLLYVYKIAGLPKPIAEEV